MRSGGFFQKLTAILQHATAEKRAGDDMMKPGVRVVRGPDWDKKRQDGGEGHVGTIVYVPKSGSSDKKVTVIWDNGRELRYRAGHDGKYDLRVYDNGPTGEIHDTITCDECKEYPVIGLRWKCIVCEDFDLCTKCYMDDQHDLTHGFLRIDTRKSRAVAMAPRTYAKRRPILGAFKGAKVMRGPHWKWKNDDGGGSGEGDVLETVTWNDSGYRGGVKVKWKDTKKEGIYRMGGEGCIDVIYINDVMSGQYYMTHLPVVDIVNPGEVVLTPSDKIRVNLGLKEFERLQDNRIYGGWNDRMVQCTQELGTVVRKMFEGKTVRVQYLDGKEWNINALAATRIYSFCAGEAVKIEEDINSVRELQDGHGGWNDSMADSLGQLGRIVRIDRDGDMMVKVNNKRWMFNPVVCNPVEDPSISDKVPELSQSELNNDKRDSMALSRDLDDAAAALADLFAVFLKEAASRDDEEDANLCEMAAKGDLDQVKTIIRRHPEQVNMKVENKTPLHLAAYEGQVEVMRCLLQHKADAMVTDEEGDTALHFAAFGGEEVALKMLIEHGVNINAQNKKGLVPLHVTVGKANVPCTKLLLKHKASVNVKDTNGDTPMHDCILQTKKQQQLLQEVLQAPGADFTICNNKGFDILQWATLKNCIRAAEMVIEKNGGIAKRQMKEGYTALHIAAANDHVEIASLLLTKTPCNTNAKDNNERTPLHIAVSQKHKRTVELLISFRADVSAADKDGNSPLHVAQLARPLSDQVAQLLGIKKDHDDVGNQIMAMLIQAGANPEAKNKKGETPVSLCKDGSTRDFMQKVHQQRLTKSFATTSGKGVLLPPHWSSMGKETVMRVQIDTTSGLMKAEFDAVENNFRRTMAQSQILKIDRVQNKFLWEHYALTKRHFEKEHGPGRSNELSLFHGTTPDKVEIICEQNFDPRLSGDRVGSLFGQGAYFASTAKLSDGYATADKNRHRFMFQVKVLAGKVTLGDKDYRRPPPINEREPKSKLYDACVDDTNAPRIFRIFDQNQYYPEYIIEYM